MFHPTFEIGSNVQRANELFIESFLREGSNTCIPPSSGEFTNNSLCYDKIRLCAPNMDIILG